MSNIVEGRAKLEALAQAMKEKGDRGTAQKLTNIINEYLYRSHVGVAQGPKKVKRASKKADAKKSAKKHAPEKKAKAEKSATKKSPAKAPAKTAEAAKPKTEKVAKPKATPASAAGELPAGMDFPANI